MIPFPQLVLLEIPASFSTLKLEPSFFNFLIKEKWKNKIHLSGTHNHVQLACWLYAVQYVHVLVWKT